MTTKAEGGACEVRLARPKRLKSTRGQDAAALRACEEWNERIPIGAEVCLHRDNGERVRTRTRSAAQFMCGSAVAWFDGISGAYAIDHAHPLTSVEPAPQAPPEVAVLSGRGDRDT